MGSTLHCTCCPNSRTHDSTGTANSITLDNSLLQHLGYTRVRTPAQPSYIHASEDCPRTPPPPRIMCPSAFPLPSLLQPPLPRNSWHQAIASPPISSCPNVNDPHAPCLRCAGSPIHRPLATQPICMRMRSHAAPKLSSAGRTSRKKEAAAPGCGAPL